MAGGSGRLEKAEESRLKIEAAAAAKKAEGVNPFELEQRARIKALADREPGKAGPIDVRNMPGSGVGMSLFAEAKQSRDAGRVGRGLASLDERMLGMAGTGAERAFRLAGLADNRYNAFLHRPKEQSFLKSLALGGLSAAGSAFNLTKI